MQALVLVVHTLLCKTQGGGARSVVCCTNTQSWGLNKVRCGFIFFNRFIIACLVSSVCIVTVRVNADIGIIIYIQT